MSMAKLSVENDALYCSSKIADATLLLEKTSFKNRLSFGCDGPDSPEKLIVHLATSCSIS